MITMMRKHKFLQPAIRGKLADLLDAPIASARVILSGTKLKEKLSSVTGSEGLFMFTRIPPGSYTLEVNYGGFSKLVQRGIAVRNRTITGLDLKMNFQEDSRTIKLQAMSLAFFNDNPPKADSLTSDLTTELSAVVAGLVLDKVHFNPPAIFEIGRMTTVELGIYQNLKEVVMRHLLERNICDFDRSQIAVTLEARLQVDGCQVVPIDTSKVIVNGSRYLGWEWDIRPKIPGSGSMHLQLDADLHFNGYGTRKKRLLTLDRVVEIKSSHWSAWRCFLGNRAR